VTDLRIIVVGVGLIGKQRAYAIAKTDGPSVSQLRARANWSEPPTPSHCRASLGTTTDSCQP
jgi:hypothetical protein